jgi:mRNA-degrading endonuclease RelE of RelBE toxin-antitoxin system
VRVEVAEQVVDFVRRLAPEPRRQLRKTLRDLAKGHGDIKSLEGPLSGYCRLRVRGYRVILSYAKRGSVQCIYAERRSVIYELFADTLRDLLRRGSSS